MISDKTPTIFVQTKNNKNPPTMAAPLSLAAVQAVVRKMVVGTTFTLKWADIDDAGTMLTWKCLVMTKGTDSSCTYTSADADDVAYQFDLPSLFVPEEGEAQPADGDLDVMDVRYHEITLAAVSAKRGKAGHKKKSLVASSIVAWKRSTWAGPLNMEGDASILGRELVVCELRRQLAIPDRANEAAFSSTSEHERCALGEALYGVVDLLTVLDKSSQQLKEIDNVVDPLLRRLCEHRAGDNKSGAARTAAMERVRHAFGRQDFKQDDITLAVLGLPAQGKGVT